MSRRLSTGAGMSSLVVCYEPDDRVQCASSIDVSQAAVGVGSGTNRQRIQDGTVRPAGRRAARASGRGGARGSVRGRVRAPSSGALSLLPLDRARRRRRAGRAPIDLHRRVRRSRARPARCADSPLAVPHRAQRGRLDASAPAPDDGVVGGDGRRHDLSRGSGRGASRPRTAPGRSARVTRAPALCPGHARAERSLARGDRACPRDLGRRGQAGDLRGATVAVRVRRGSSHAVR